jgi:ABC-type branched-subunit amino acid transport system substrate-binding protein
MCVVGHINSGVALAALPTYQSANLIMISPANTSPRITEEFDDTAYRVVGRDDVQGVVAADFVADTLQSKTAFVVHDQTAYGEGLATVFQTRAQEKGITIAGFVGTAETAVFDSVLLQVQAANPDAVFFGGTYNVGGPFLRQLRDRGITARVMGGDGMDSSTVAELAGDAAVGLNYVTISGPASSYPNAAQFAQDYQAEFDAPAAYPAFQAYDSTRACLSAVVEAANAANGRPTREQVKEAMQELAPFEGVTGDVEFNDEGDREPAIYYVFEAVSGNPDEWANNTVAGQLEQSPPADD